MAGLDSGGDRYSDRNVIWGAAAHTAALVWRVYDPSVHEDLERLPDLPRPRGQ